MSVFHFNAFWRLARSFTYITIDFALLLRLFPSHGFVITTLARFLIPVATMTKIKSILIPIHSRMDTDVYLMVTVKISLTLHQLHS
jgi:hypothetical protein